MSFLKNNAFLVATAATLVVGVAVIVVLGNSWRGDFERHARRRSDPSRNLANVAKKLVNQNVLDADRKAVQGMQAEHRKVADRFFARTAGSYKVMQFEPGDLRQDKPQPAFPMPAELRELMRLQFAKAYERNLKKLLEPLKPTWRPTDDEIRQLRQAMQKKTELAGERTGAAAVPTEVYRPPLEAEPGGLGAETVKKDPFQVELEKLVAAKSAGGSVYADTSVLHPRLREEVRYNDSELYLAEVARWVHQDVVEAIRQTNAAAPSRQQQRKGVAASAVRQLVSSRLLGYVVNLGLGSQSGIAGGGDTAGGQPRAGGATGGALTPGMSQRTMQTYLGLVGGGGLGAGQELERFGAVGGGGLVGGRTLAWLTGRVTNQLYDVVHYELKVLMDDRDVVRLFENLMRQNYHTILDVTMTRPRAQRTQGGGVLGEPGGGGAQLEREGLFDYGPAPLMQVTIKGELLLMADFTRGRWNEQAKKFDEAYPPLMPVELLQAIDRSDTNALREQDRKQLPQMPIPAIPMGGPSYGANR